MPIQLFQIGNRKLTGGFKRLQRIRHDPGANDDLVCGAHESDCQGKDATFSIRRRELKRHNTFDPFTLRLAPAAAPAAPLAFIGQPPRVRVYESQASDLVERKPQEPWRESGLSLPRAALRAWMAS